MTAIAIVCLALLAAVAAIEAQPLGHSTSTRLS